MRTCTAVRDLEGVSNKAPPKRYSLRSGPPLQPAARRIPEVTWQGKGAVHSKAQSGNATGKDVAVEKPKQAIVELLEIIRNADYLQQLLSSMDYNYREYPPSQLSKDDIRRGFSKLRDISRSIYRLDSSDEMPKCRTSCRRQDSTEYYSSIPHEFLKKPHPVINTENLVAKELDLLTILSYIKDMGEDTAISDEQVIVLPKNDNEFLHIQKYLNQSHNDEYRNYEVKDIFRIKRRAEAERIKSFQSSTSTSKSRLLWHGSPVPSYGGILSHGLRVAPIQEPQSGDLLCKGIYFADMSCVSIEHCRSYSTGGEALLLLCEVEVGEYPLEIFSPSLKTGNVTCKSNKHSTFIRGRTGPSQWIDAAEIHESLIGIEMPDPAFDPGDTSYPFAPSNYNKYICYNESQIHIRYLIRIRF